MMESEAGTMLRGLLWIQNNLRQEGNWNKSGNIYPSSESRGKRTDKWFFWKPKESELKRLNAPIIVCKGNLPFSFPDFLFLLPLGLTLLLSRSGKKVVQVWWCTPIIWVLPRLGVRSSGSTLATKCVQSHPGLHKSASLNTQTNMVRLATMLWGKK